MVRIRSLSAGIAIGAAAFLGGCVAPGPYYAAGGYPYYVEPGPVVVSPSVGQYKLAKRDITLRIHRAGTHASTTPFGSADPATVVQVTMPGRNATKPTEIRVNP